MEDQIAGALRLLFDTGQVVELRALFGDATASGYYDDMAQLASDVEKVEAAQPQGIYVTLNEANPALLSRRANRTKMRLGKKDATTADADIIRRRWFPIDIDAVRPSGVSSTDAEHTAAITKADRVAQYLTEEGWPDPVIADSGNGAHLLYRIDLPNDPKSLDLVKKALESLALLFNDQGSTIDIANHNAARIWKLYGTVSRKGDSTKTRPHRKADLLSVPDILQVVTGDHLERLAGALRCTASLSTTTPPKAGGQPIDLGRWLRDHAIGIADEKPYQGGILFTLDECPFSGAHKDGSFAIQFPSGAIYAGCHHSSCGGGEQRWQELRQKFEPRGDRRRTASVDKPPPPPGSPGSPSPLPVSDITKTSHYDEAMTVLRHGDPLKAMLTTFSLDHVGDEIPAECLIMSLASRSVENTNGLHVSVSGESGKGKSDTFNKILLQVPEQVKLEGAMSNKFLFYKDDMKSGTVIVFDDKILTDDMQEILKGSTSSFKKPIIYRTVSKDRKAMVCSIPERCIWWVAKVEGSGDDQVFNRMLTCWIDDSPEQDAAVLVDMAEREVKAPGLSPTRPEVITCRAMWEIIGNERIHVTIPFAPRIEFQTKTNRRNPEMFYSLIKAHAVLFFMQRERHSLDGGGPFIEATLEDFEAAAGLFGMLNGTVGGQETKLTRREAELLTAIAKAGGTEFTIQQMQELTNLSYSSVHRILHGYQSRGTAYSGLLDKCPAIGFTDRTVVSDDDIGRSVRRRSHAYQFNLNTYRLWSSGGAVWLRPDDDNNDHDGSSNPAENSRFAETAANIIEDEYGPETGNRLFNKKIFIINSTNHGNSVDTASPIAAVGSPSVCICEHESAANEIDNEVFHPQISEAAPETADNPSSTFREHADNSVKSTVPLHISSKDYKLLDHLEYRTWCVVCGHKGTEYIEKLTPERKARTDKTALRICKVCYKTARKREQGEGPPLPGVLAIGRMVRISKDIGRCSVCNLGKAVYSDREAGTSICQQCYDREARAIGSAEGGVGP